MCIRGTDNLWVHNLKTTSALPLIGLLPSFMTHSTYPEQYTVTLNLYLSAKLKLFGIRVGGNLFRELPSFWAFNVQGPRH